jgi:hypothetical protein
MAKENKTICDCCNTDYHDYGIVCGAIPPAGIFSNFNEYFVCDECIKKYYLNTYDVFNILYQKSELNNDFSKDLLYAIKYFIPHLFKLSRKVIPGKVRQKVLKKYDFKCTHCNSTKNLAIDHIKPYSKGGSDTIKNLQVLCKSCNSKKGNK